jgi:translation initiation factor IF-1
MEKQIKVEHTKQHSRPVVTESKMRKDIPVVEGKLVLVECNSTDALFNKYLGDPLVIHDRQYAAGRKFYKPIIISETEKIEVGDWYYDERNKLIKQLTYQDLMIVPECGYFKILALPEHSSPEQLQTIVDGKLKDGDKVLVECEKQEQTHLFVGFSKPHPIIDVIKLNSSNHITLHKVEEKMYTKVEVLNILKNWEKERKTAYSYADVYGLEKWFKQNLN